MLIKFKTDAYADITMFGDVAKQLLKMMGHSGTVPSAILAEDVPAALNRLRHALEGGKAPAPSAAEAAETASTDAPGKGPQGAEADDDQAVSLAYRAIPLIELLTAAARKKRDVMWEKL